MAVGNSAEIIDQYDVDEVLSDAERKRKEPGVYRIVIYSDGRVEKWLRSRRESADTHGARVPPTDQERETARKMAEEYRRSNPEPKPKSPDEERKGKADADKAEADAIVARRNAENPPASSSSAPTVRQFPDGSERQYNPKTGEWDVLAGAKKPETVVRTKPDAMNPGWSVTEEVTTTQAAFDRQAAQDIYTRAQAAEEAALARANQQIASGRLSLEQIKFEHEKAMDAIRTQLQQEVNALTRRSQDVSLRGQDVNAGVSQRNADMDYEADLARSGTGFAGQLLDKMAPTGAAAAWSSVIGGSSSPPPVAPMQFPSWATPTLPLDLARQARGQAPARFQAPAWPEEPVPHRLPG